MFTEEDAELLLEEYFAGSVDIESISSTSKRSKKKKERTDLDIFAASRKYSSNLLRLASELGFDFSKMRPSEARAARAQLGPTLQKIVNEAKRNVANAYKEAVDEMKNAMVDYAGWHIDNISPNDVVVQRATNFEDFNGHAAWRVSFSFSPESVFRPSVIQDPDVASGWKQDRYTRFNGVFGVEDIIELLIKGYDAKRAIRYKLSDSGDWRWTRRSYHPSDADNFMADLVEDYNEKHSADDTTANGDYVAFARLLGAYR